jgi:hypothetical protein
MTRGAVDIQGAFCNISEVSAKRGMIILEMRSDIEKKCGFLFGRNQPTVSGGLCYRT